MNTAAQAEEIYARDFAENVEKTLEEIEQNPNFSVNAWVANTVTETITIFLKYVKETATEKSTQTSRLVIPMGRLHSREGIVDTIRNGLERTLVEATAPEGFSLQGREIQIVTAYTGWLVDAIQTKTIREN